MILPHMSSVNLVRGQLIILSILSLESFSGIFEGGSISGGGGFAIIIVALLIGVEGLCGGLA